MLHASHVGGLVSYWSVRRPGATFINAVAQKRKHFFLFPWYKRCDFVLYATSEIVRDDIMRMRLPPSWFRQSWRNIYQYESNFNRINRRGIGMFDITFIKLWNIFLREVCNMSWAKGILFERTILGNVLIMMQYVRSVEEQQNGRENMESFKWKFYSTENEKKNILIVLLRWWHINNAMVIRTFHIWFIFLNKSSFTLHPHLSMFYLAIINTHSSVMDHLYSIMRPSLRMNPEAKFRHCKYCFLIPLYPCKVYQIQI